MAKGRRNSSNDADSNLDPIGAGYSGLDSDAGGSGSADSATTGRKIVTILSDDPSDKQKVIEYFQARDVKELLRSADYEESAYDPAEADSSEAVVLDNLPVIILNQRDNVRSALAAQAVTIEDEEIRRLFVVEDEMRHFPSSFLDSDQLEANPDDGNDARAPRNAGGTLSPYYQGYLKGIQAIATSLLTGNTQDGLTDEGRFGGGAVSTADFSGCFSDSSSATWGLQATRVSQSSLTGNGIRIAILDTGFEFGHSDNNFASRVVGNATFVGGTAQDHHGHGTHVAGTACGPVNPGLGTRRYGVAPESEILVARVLGPQGGNDSSVLGGINWALGRGCDLINMSLGPRVCRLNPAFSASHERVARIALSQGVLMIAAAGNNSNRPFRICPVVGPAAAPSIVAVAAVDQCGRIARFSNQGQNTTGGEINFAGPGVNVFSAWTNPTRHRHENGTSMAAPHVTGIAALVAQQTGLRGIDLYREVRSRVLNIGHSRADMGNGFVQV